MKAILIASGKGGVGKSTVSAFLGQALALRGKKVLLVELDCGLRSLDVALGVAKDVALDFGDVARGGEAEKAVMPCPFCPGLSVLCAAGSRIPVEAETLRRIFDFASENFDFLLWDCPAGIGELLDTAKDFCGLALVIATPDPSSIRAAQRVGTLFRDEKAIERRLIINRCPENPKKLTPIRNLDEIIDQTELQLLGVLWDDPKTRIAFDSGALLGNESPNRKNFTDIAGRILGERIPLGFK